MAADRLELIDWIETRLQTRTVAAEGATESSVSVDLESVRRRAEHALPKAGQQGHNDAHAEAQRMARELDELLDQARLAIEAGDGETALDVLAALTEVLVTNRWAGLLPHDVPDLFETLDELGVLFIEAVLTAELDPSERSEWEQRLREWDDDTAFKHFMSRSVLGAAADAVMDGWNVTDVVDVRLRILDRQGRTDEYLNLSLAAGADTAHAEKLAETSRIEEAVEYGLTHLSNPSLRPSSRLDPLLEMSLPVDWIAAVVLEPGQLLSESTAPEDRLFEQLFSGGDEEVGNATNGWKALESFREQDEAVERTVIFTDMQIWDSTPFTTRDDRTVKSEFDAYRDEVTSDTALYLVDLAS